MSSNMAPRRLILECGLGLAAAWARAKDKRNARAIGHCGAQDNCRGEFREMDITYSLQSVFIGIGIRAEHVAGLVDVVDALAHDGNISVRPRVIAIDVTGG